MSLNINQWVGRFRGLDPDNQLKVAKTIVEELELNRSALKEEDGYNNDQSIIIEDKIKEYIHSLKDETKKDYIKGLLESFDGFSEDEKISIIKNFIWGIENTLEQAKAKNDIMACAMKGHKFTQWNRRLIQDEPVFIPYEATIGPREVIDGHPIYDKVTRYIKSDREHYIWERYCEKCGLYQKAESLIEVEEITNKTKCAVRQLKMQNNSN